MKNTRKIALAMALFGLMSGVAHSIEVVNKDDVKLNMHGTLQSYAFTNYVNDEYRDHLRLLLFVRQARLRFTGEVNTIKFDVQYAFGGEEGVKNTGGTVANSSLGLLDFSADVPVPFLSQTYFKFGQYKVPYGLERLEYSANLMYADRSIATLPFNQGRDVGFSLVNSAEHHVLSGSIFTGGGRDNPIRDLPIRLGSPMLVVRGGYKNGIDENLFEQKQTDYDQLKPGFALFGNALYMEDSRVGHSTVMQTKAVEKGLLTDSNWNPYIGVADVTGVSNFVTGDLWQAGADMIWRKALASGIFSTEAEANYGIYKNTLGYVEATGGRVQVGYSKSFWGLGLRYAVIFPDDKFAKSGRKVTGQRDPIHEITPSLTLYHKKFFKIVMDAPLLIDVPVSVESSPTKLGAYVLTDQPDQTNAGAITRQTVPSGRLVMQFSF